MYSSLQASPIDLIIAFSAFLLPFHLPFSMEERILLVASGRILLLAILAYGLDLRFIGLSPRKWGYGLLAAAVLLMLSAVLQIPAPMTAVSPLLLILALLPAAISEELFFRYYLMARLTQLGLAYPLVLATALLFFASAHAYQGYQGWLFSLLAAEIFTLLVQKNNSLLPAIIAHWTYNVIFFSLLFYL